MIVECPNCHTKFNLPEEKARPEAKLKCSKCGNIFGLDTEEEGQTGPPVEDKKQLVQEFDEAQNGDASGRGRKKGGEKGDFNLDVGTKERGSSKKLVWAMFIVLLLIAGAFAAYFFVPQFSGYVNKMMSNDKLENSVARNQESRETQIEDIHLENVRQYFVRNDKIGQVFVIEGKAVNRFEVPKELIKLKAVLYDEQGKAVSSKEFFCGNNVSLFQLQVSSMEELESSLNARVGVLTNNTFLKSGQSTPFMVAFYDPPEEVQEFGLEVIQAKNPPEDKD